MIINTTMQIYAKCFILSLLLWCLISDSELYNTSTWFYFRIIGRSFFLEKWAKYVHLVGTWLSSVSSWWIWEQYGWLVGYTLVLSFKDHHRKYITEEINNSPSNIRYVFIVKFRNTKLCPEVQKIVDNNNSENILYQEYLEI